MAEPEVENFSNHRLFVGGLFPEITKDELQERFKSFGEVNSVEIKIRKDYDGSPIKTFAYVDMKTDDTNLKKLMNIYNRSKWKGSQLKIQKAKENFLLRLEKERQEQEELKKKIKEIKDTKDDLMKTTDNVGDGNIANMKPSDAKPGTLVPGQKNWIVGKYGRVLPIVQMKRNGRSKLVKIDPSKYTHAVKRIKETDDKPDTKVNLTWELEERDNDVTKKRKGEYPTWRSGKKKCSDFTEIQSKLNEIISRYKVDDDNTEMEVVPVASDKNTGSVALRNSRGKVMKDSRKSYDVGVERFDTNSDSNDDVTLENSTGQRTAMDLSRFDSDSDNDNDDSGLTGMFIPVKNSNKGKIENQSKTDFQLRKEQTIAKKSVSSVHKESSSTDNQGSTKYDDKKGVPAPKIIEGKKKLKEFQGLRFLSSNTTVSDVRPVKETKSASKSSKYASSDDEDHAEICGPTVFKQSGDRVNTNIFQSKTFTSQKLSQSKTFASHDLLTDEFSSGIHDTSHKAEDLKDLSDNDDDSDFESFVKREMLKTKSPGINERLGTNIKVNATSQKKTVGDTVSTTVNKTVEDMIVGSNVSITLDTKPNSKSEFANDKLENASENSMTSNDSDEDVDTFDEESDSIENQSVKSNDEYNISNVDSDNKDKNKNKSKNFQHGKQTIDNNSVSSFNEDRISSSTDKPKRIERTKSDDKKGVPEPMIIEGKKKLKEFQGIRFLSSYNQVLVSDEKPVQETRLASMPKKYVSSDEEDNSVEICGPTVSKQSVGQLKTNFFQPKAFASHNLLADEFFCGITDASHTPKEDEQLSDDNDDDDSDFESFVKREMLKSKSSGVNKRLDTNIKVNANSQKKTTEDSVEGTDIKKTLNDKPNSQSALTYGNKSESNITSDDSDNDDPSDSENDSMENENTRSNAEPNIANSNCAAGTVTTLKDGTKEDLKNLQKDVRNDIPTSDDSGEESGDNVKDDDVDEMNGNDVDSNEDDEDSDSNSDADDDTGDDDDDGSNDEDDISVDDDEESDDDSDFEKLISEAVNEIKTTEGTESSETDKPSLIVDIGKIKESDDTSVNKPNKISSNDNESYMEVNEAKLGSESEDSDSESEGSDSGSDESDTDSEDANNESGDSNSESDGSDSTNEDSDSVSERKDDNILNIKKLEKDPVSEESETLLDVTKLTTADDKISSGTESCNMNTTCNKVNEKGGKTSDSNSKSINAKDFKEKMTMSKRQGLVQSRSKEENDRKRLEALKQKQKENMAQKSLIQTALANIDKGVPTNNKIIFESDSDDDGNNNDDKGDDNTKLNDGDDNDSDTDDDDDDDEDNDDDDDDDGDDNDDDDNDNNATLNARKYGVETKTKSLFDSSDDDDDDDDDDERFKIRKEFEGTAGSKLATLQSRYGNDERFKLDSRFIESDTDEDVPAVVDQEDETQRSLKILQSVVGIKAMKGVTFNEKARKKFKDIGSLKYDPTKVEHQEQFEVKRKMVETSDENESKKKKKKTDKQDQVEPEIVLPEVSKEKFHQISDTLTDIFKKKSQSESQNEALTGSGFSLLSTFGNNQSEDKPQNGSQTGSGFSLLSMFGKNQSDDEADNSVEDVAIPIPQTLRTDHLSLDNRFKVVDDDNGDDDEKEQPSSDDDEQSPDSKKNLNTESTTSSDQQNIFNRPSTFFFLPNDLRLKDSVEKTSKIVDRETWFEKKRELVSCHKKKYKNYMRKHKDGKRRNNNARGSHRGGHHR
ncbi:nucleolar protein 8 [Mactra antiquata]